MFSVKLIRSVRGWAKFKAEGGFCERFLNLASQNGVNLWGVQRRDGELIACVPARQYRLLRTYAKKTGTRLRLIDRGGLPFTAHRYRKRIGIPLGVVLFGVFLLYMTGFIWSITLEGNETVAEAVILEALDRHGITVGSRKNRSDYEEIEQMLLLELGDISWITLNVSGTELSVIVRERDAPPQMLDSGTPANVVAAKTGQILSVEAYEGMAMAEEGDVVLEGDLLVSGVFEDQNGGYTLRHARARVMAITQNTEVVEVPMVVTISTQSGKVVERNFLRVFSFDLPLFVALPLKGEFDRTVDTSDVSVLGYKLPMWFIRQAFTPVIRTIETLTREQAHAEALRLLGEIQIERYADVTVLRVDTEGSVINNVYRLTANVVCEEDIALSREIYTKETNSSQN